MLTFSKFEAMGFVAKAKVITNNGNKFAELVIGTNWKGRANQETGEVKEGSNFTTTKVFKESLLNLMEQGHLAVGRYVRITGDLKDTSYEKNEQTVYELSAVTTRVDFCERKKD